MSDLRLQIGTSIKQVRSRKGLSQGELGAEMSKILGRPIKEGQISDWESGRNFPRLDAMVAIATVLETSIDVLVRGEKSFADQLIELDRRLREVEGRR